MTLLIILVLMHVLLRWYIMRLATKHEELAGLLKINKEQIRKVSQKYKSQIIKFIAGIILLMQGIKTLEKTGISLHSTLLDAFAYIISGELIITILLNFRLITTLIAVHKNKKFRKIAEKIVEVTNPQYNAFKTITEIIVYVILTLILYFASKSINILYILMGEIAVTLIAFIKVLIKTLRKPKIKLVCLDLDGVFFEKVHDKLIVELSKILGIGKTKLKKILFEKGSTEGGYNLLKLGKMNSSKYWKWYAQQFNIKDWKSARKMHLTTLTSIYKINPKAISLIKRLKTKSIKIGLISNNWKDNIENLKKRFNLEKYFDYMIFSYEVGVLKPDTKIYQKLLEQSNVKPNQVVFFDDKAENVKAAKKLGFNAYIASSFNEVVQQIKALKCI